MTSSRPFHFPDLEQAARVAVWATTANCRLIEEENGPAYYQEGSGDEPLWVSRRDAWRDTYARELINMLNAEPAQLHRAAITACDSATERHSLKWWLNITIQRWREAPDRTYRMKAIRLALSPAEHADEHAFWECANEICSRALHIMTESGADTNTKDRQRLLAGIKHHLTMTAFGNVMPEVATDSEQQLLDRLTDIDHPPPEAGEQEDHDDR